jgi:hypothetical protein
MCATINGCPAAEANLKIAAATVRAHRSFQHDGESVRSSAGFQPATRAAKMAALRLRRPGKWRRPETEMRPWPKPLRFLVFFREFRVLADVARYVVVNDRYRYAQSRSRFSQFPNPP